MNALVKLFFVYLLLLCTEAFPKTYYVSPGGQPGNDGNSFAFAKDFKSALALVVAGDSILLQGSRYIIPISSSDSINSIRFTKSGQAGKPIYVVSYNNSRAVFDFSFPSQAWYQDAYGFNVTGSYWYFKGIDITRAGYQGAYVRGSYTTFDNCAFYENRNTGLEINKGGSYTTVINCDAYRNYDPKKKGSMADGFGPKQTQGPGNKFIGCRSWENSDDGYDCFDSPEIVTFENCWAFRNGVDVWQYGGFTGNGNGFKVGGNYQIANNKLTRCISFGNPSKGFDQNNNMGGITIYNCFAYLNGINYGLGGTLASGQSHILRNNISLGSSVSVANAQQSNNSWSSGFSASNSNFQSLDTTLARIARNADGSLPETPLFRLKPTSTNLIDKGVNVGLSFNGSAPDLGCYETGTSANTPPSASITSPVNNSSFVALATIVIDATATDADGNISKVEFYQNGTLIGVDNTVPYSYTWSGVSAGSYVLTVKAYDNQGETSVSSGVTVSVNTNQPSLITISSPQNNSTTTGTIAIGVTASDPDGSIVKVEYFDGTTWIGSSTGSSPYTFLWNNAEAGTHTVTVKVTDSNGGITTSNPLVVTISTPTAVIHSSAGEVTVYPNPSSGAFKISGSNPITHFWIINSHGEPVEEVDEITDGLHLETGASIPAGMYVLIVEYASGRRAITKIVKAK